MLNFLRKLFNKAPSQKILVFCGAGISAESGLNTFRDKGGLWTQYDVDVVCNLKTFSENRSQVFDFHNLVKREIIKSEPNAAHVFLAQLQQQYGAHNVMIFTSNIDNLLEKAGCQHVCHVHGDINSMKCLDCHHTWHIGNADYNINDTCPQCKSNNIKPDITFFNEVAEKYKILHSSFESSGEIIKAQIIPNIKLLVGTSFNVIPVNAFKVNRGHTILIDPNPNIDGYEQHFESIINKSAVDGISEARQLIKNLYKS